MGKIENAKSPLTECELEILKFICKGRSNEQIADIISLTEKQIATHSKKIMQKAGVSKTMDLIIWALDKDILQKNG